MPIKEKKVILGYSLLALIIIFFSSWIGGINNNEEIPNSNSNNNTFRTDSSTKKSQNAFTQINTNTNKITDNTITTSNNKNNENSILSNFLSRIETAKKLAEQDLKIKDLSNRISKNNNEIILNLTNEEFNYLYPASFIKSLEEGAQIYLKSINPNYNSIKISNDSDVRKIETSLVEAFKKDGKLSKEEAESALYSIQILLPELQLISLSERDLPQGTSFLDEINNYYQILTLSPKIFKNYFINPLPQTDLNAEKIEKLALLAQIFKTLIIPEVKAACGSCSSSPLCVRDGGLADGKAGPVLFKIACECNGCLYGQGCLDSCSGFAAIYDGSPGYGAPSFLCGCGGP